VRISIAACVAAFLLGALTGAFILRGTSILEEPDVRVRPPSSPALSASGTTSKGSSSSVEGRAPEQAAAPTPGPGESGQEPHVSRPDPDELVADNARLRAVSMLLFDLEAARSTIPEAEIKSQFEVLLQAFKSGAYAQNPHGFRHWEGMVADRLFYGVSKGDAYGEAWLLLLGGIGIDIKALEPEIREWLKARMNDCVASVTQHAGDLDVALGLAALPLSDPAFDDASELRNAHNAEEFHLLIQDLQRALPKPAFTKLTDFFKLVQLRVTAEQNEG
jgi:hypothetical protein